MEVLMKKLENESVNAMYDIIAAMDFGTTFSGYAWAIINEFDGQNIDSIHMNKEWGTSLGVGTHKTPTCVLLDRNGQLKEFGYEATKSYTQLVQDDEIDGHELYSRFKMLLYKEKKFENGQLRCTCVATNGELRYTCVAGHFVTRNTTIKSIQGVEHKAIDIFAASLRYMKNHLIESVAKTNFGTINERRIYWVVTLPAFWGDKAKQFMREAAMMAGLVTKENPKQLIFALEPEAAAIYCQTLEINQFDVGSQERKKVKFDEGTRYMIIDAGGGTVDITAHEVLRNGNFKELLPASGGDWGGTKVNEQIELFLDDILGHDFMKKYKEEFPDQWLQHSIHLENKKRGTQPDGKTGFKLSMPLSVYMQFNKFYNGKDLETHIQEIEKERQLGISFKNYFLNINNKTTSKLFEPVINDIVDHVRKITPKVANLQHIFLVGGFGESPFLFKGLQEALTPQYNVLIPMGAEVSILKGAVLFGYNPHKVVSRISKFTYGHSWFAKFQARYHDPERKIKDERGRELCQNAFRVYIEKGEDVQVGEVRTFSTLPWSSKDTATSIIILASDNKNVLYSDEPGVSQVGKIVLMLPPLKDKTSASSQQRKIQTSFMFGGTEIEVEAKEATSGGDAIVKTKIDFL